MDCFTQGTPNDVSCKFRLSAGRAPAGQSSIPRVSTGYLVIIIIGILIWAQGNGFWVTGHYVYYYYY